MRGQVLLTQPRPNWFGRERKREKEQTEKEGEKKRDSRVRSSHFSLGFPAIGPSNLGEARGKVDPHCKSYAWVPVLWSFNKLREVEVFFYLDILCLKSHENGFGCCEAGNGHEFSVPQSGIDD